MKDLIIFQNKEVISVQGDVAAASDKIEIYAAKAFHVPCRSCNQITNALSGWTSDGKFHMEILCPYCSLGFKMQRFIQKYFDLVSDRRSNACDWNTGLEYQALERDLSKDFIDKYYEKISSESIKLKETLDPKLIIEPEVLPKIEYEK